MPHDDSNPRENDAVSDFVASQDPVSSAKQPDETPSPVPDADEPVVAELVRRGPGPAFAVPLNLPPMHQNVAAVGGSIGSVVLGIWAILGSLITPYSGINGVIGIALGIWGLLSQKRRWAVIGILLSLLGVGMSLAKVSELISIYLNQVEEV